MKIRNFSHKGLSALYTEGNPKGVRPDTVDKLRKMFALLDAIESPDELRAVTVWKVHTLMATAKAHGL